MKERFGLRVAPHERPPVAWYEFAGLWRVAREQLWSLNLLRNLDRRESFAPVMPLIPVPGDGEVDGDFWIDFVADTGDGSCSTTAVAQAMLAPRLQAEGLPAGHAAGLPSGRLLVFGGDLAYPGASPDHYQARLVEPFELARPAEAFDTDRIVVAIPQNHDWMDSLSTFCRYFVNRPQAGLLKARAPQTHSYFALALPHGWFMLGFDFSLAGDLDRMQFDSFRALLGPGGIPPGAPVMLVYPEPYWSRPIGDRAKPGYPKRYQRLEALLVRHGCRIQLRLAGDLHHYVRESLPVSALGHPSELVTCGSGGAFGHPTHAREVQQPKCLLHGIDHDAAQDDLRERVLVGRSPPEAGGHEQADGRVHLFSGERRFWPRPETTRRRAWGNVLALLRARHAGFVGTLTACTVAGTLLPGWWGLLGALPGTVAAITVATENDPGKASRDEWLLVVPLAAGVLALVAAMLPLAVPWRVPVAWLGLALLFGGYLALMSALFGRVPNNAASALSGEREKGFLRLRVHAGGVEAFMLGVDEVPRLWERNPAGWPYWRPRGDPARWRVVDRFELRR